MNSRLLSPEEKQWNKRSRQLRKDRQKRIGRRNRALETVGDPYLIVDELALTPVEIGCLLWPADLRAVKSVIHRLNRLILASDPGVSADPISTPHGAATPRPIRVLRRANRGAVPPALGAPVALPREFIGAERALQLARELAATGSSQLQILRFLAHPTATGLPLEACAKLACHAGLLWTSTGSVLLEVLKRAAAFESRMEEGATLYRAGLLMGEVGLMPGDWRLFTHFGLCELLPGLRLPKKLRRDRYLVKVMASQHESPPCLDFYSVKYTGLCRHPLE